MSQTTFAGNRPLSEIDPEMFALIQEEKERQINGLELIASENFTSAAVMTSLGSCLTNKYSEGQPGKRYYGGNEVIDKVENLAVSRALKAFHLDPKLWGCNVQPYSGSVANLGALLSILNPGDKILGLALNAGGHLSHGHQSETKKISATSVYYNCISYSVNEHGLIDYEALDKQIQAEKPKLLIAGASAYPRDWEYDKMRKSMDKVGGFLLADIAHISGLVASQQQKNPFEWCHLVTTTTHKSLRGPRAGIIFFQKGKITVGEKEYELEAAVNFAVFPCLQGGPHENQIGAIATTLKEVDTAEFKEYSIQIIKNAKALAKALMDKGYNIQTGGTDNHLMLLRVGDVDLTGSKVEKCCDLVGITINKNMVVGDKSALAPSGVRLGTPALTSRGFKEGDFLKVAEFLDETIKLCVRIQKVSGKKLTDFVDVLEKDEQVLDLKKRVQDFAKNFPIPGL